MEEKNQENMVSIPKNERSEEHARGDLDAAGKSLSSALRMSFIILQIFMVALVILFLASGFKTIGPDEQGLVLRFGKIRGAGENRILKPGLVGPLPWLGQVFPYPIDEIIRIPVAKKVNLSINTFWYYQTKAEMLGQGPKKPRIRPTLHAVADGYCIVRSEKQTSQSGSSAGDDYNIVHAKWQLTYKIDDPERFFRNVYVREMKPGEAAFDVITESIKSFLEYLVADAVVDAMVHYTVDEVILSQAKIPAHVKRSLQEKLDQTESGIKIESVQMINPKWPRQVNDAFLLSIRASQERGKIIDEAKKYAQEKLNATAGSVADADRLLAAFKQDDLSAAEQDMLWGQAAGSVQETLAQARAYRTGIVEMAKANAEYLQRILPEYRKYPKLVIQRIYQDAIEEVLNNADEKIIIQPTQTGKGKEIRVLLNRDPSLKSKPKEDKDHQ